MKSLIVFESGLVKVWGLAQLYKQTALLDITLQTVLYAQALFCKAHFNKELLVTSMWRPNAGVHSDKRGFDSDVDENMAYDGLSPAEATILRDWTNGHFTYDPARLDFRVAVYGDNDPRGKHWNHMHNQTCWGHRTAINLPLHL